MVLPLGMPEVAILKVVDVEETEEARVVGEARLEFVDHTAV
jgi:hypothetical protein